MKNPPIKIVRPWPAEQPQPPAIRKTKHAVGGVQPRPTGKRS
jgi:hypothetical protein